MPKPRTMTSFRLSDEVREGLEVLANEWNKSQARLIESFVLHSLDAKRMEPNAVRKVIRGKVYNINKATKVLEWDNGYNQGEDAFYQETLYRTKKDSWFIFQIGGKDSPMSRPAGDKERTDGSDIVALDEEALFEWLQKRNKIDLLVELFPDAIDEA